MIAEDRLCLKGFQSVDYDQVCEYEVIPGETVAKEIKTDTYTRCRGAGHI